jgi:hypothetical protein
MYRIILFFLFLFSGKSYFAFPVQSKPLLIIDCGKQNGIFQEECFKWIQFATSKLSESGTFQNILSISNNSFLYRHQNQVYTTSFSEQKFYKNQQVKKYFLNEYRSESTLLMDPNHRYALIYSSAKTGDNTVCNICLEVKDTLNYSKINAWFASDKEFTGIEKTNFLKGPVTVELSFVPETKISSISAYNLTYSLQQKLYGLQKIKTVYSPVNIFSFLNTALHFNNSTPRERWESAVSMWDLSGERRSAYMDFENNRIYIDVYASEFSPDVIQNVKNTVEGSGSRLHQWGIYQNGNKIFSKIDDTKAKNNTLTINNESNEKNGKQ